MLFCWDSFRIRLSRLVCIFFLYSFLSVQCAKIAVLYMFGGSHFMTTRVIAEELSKRGHEVGACNYNVTCCCSI